MTELITPGATCHIGKGKTVWEIITVRSDGPLELSALGKGGYVNKTVWADEVNSIIPQRLEVTLGNVIDLRAKARTAAAGLSDACRFSNPDRVATNRDITADAASAFASALFEHALGLAKLGIKES